MSDYPKIKPSQFTKKDLDKIKQWYGDHVEQYLKVTTEEGRYMGLVKLSTAYQILEGIGIEKWIENVKKHNG